MKAILRPLLYIYTVYAIIIFVSILFIIFPFAIIAGFFGRIKGGNMIMGLCRLWADSWFFLIGVPFKKIYEAPHDKKRSYIFVNNHISYLDAAMIPKVYRQPIRPLGKIEMSRIPVFGFIYRRTIVAVDRSSANTRAQSMRLLRSILGKGVSVLVFPEGTFNMTTNPMKEFYDGAFRLAVETQTPIKPVLFLDSYRRMPYDNIFHMSPGRNRVVYLEEIPVVGYKGSDVPRLKQEVYALMEKKLIEYDGGWRKAKPQ